MNRYELFLQRRKTGDSFTIPLAERTADSAADEFDAQFSAADEFDAQFNAQLNAYEYHEDLGKSGHFRGILNNKDIAVRVFESLRTFSSIIKRLDLIAQANTIEIYGYARPTAEPLLYVAMEKCDGDLTTLIEKIKNKEIQLNIGELMHALIDAYITAHNKLLTQDSIYPYDIWYKIEDEKIILKLAEYGLTSRGPSPPPEKSHIKHGNYSRENEMLKSRAPELHNEEYRINYEDFTFEKCKEIDIYTVGLHLFYIASLSNSKIFKSKLTDAECFDMLTGIKDSSLKAPFLLLIRRLTETDPVNRISLEEADEKIIVMFGLS